MAKTSSRRSSGDGWAFVTEGAASGRDARARGSQPREQSGGKPTFRLRMEMRRGKPVTVAAASGVAEEVLAALLKEVKALCGAGGTLKDGQIEIQGEHRERLRQLLPPKGFAVKG